MATKTHMCGSSTVTIHDWDDSSTFVCVCSSRQCSWIVRRGDKVVTEGQGAPRIRPSGGTGPIVEVDGRLGAVAKVLQEKWGRRLTVADGRGSQRITRRLKGTRKEIAEGLGLKLGPKL